jgi:predicted nucleotidyltransferase
VEAEILTALKRIESTEGIAILYAIESGSRAWEFASPNSDYDVRFIYIRPKDAYLRLEKQRDVIELPIEGDLDINGWDLDKTLRLLHSSNPTLLEWLRSPIVYRTSDFMESHQQTFDSYFDQAASLWHYVSMAKTAYRTYLKLQGFF